MAAEKQPTKEPDSDGDLKKIEEKLTEINPKIFEGVPRAKKGEILRSLSVSIHKITSGPLPATEDLEKYAQLIPNGAERIMSMAERQQQHRMELENFVIKEQMRQSARGQIFGLIVGVVAIIGGVVCALYGHEWAAGFIGAGGVTGLVSVFVFGTRRQRKSLENKN